MTPTKYEDRTKDELQQLAAERDISGRSSMTKDELIAALRGESEPTGSEATSEVVTDEGTQSKQRKATGDRLAQIEALITEELAEAEDNGDGSRVHLLGIQSSVEGLRDAQRAWQHLTESPLSAGAAREAAS